MFTGFYARKTNTDDILDKNSYAIILNVKTNGVKNSEATGNIPNENLRNP